MATGTVPTDGTRLRVGGDDRPAAVAARRDAELWRGLLDAVEAACQDEDVSEAMVLGSAVDGALIAHDLARRARTWGTTLADGSPAALVAFGAALASTEADAWSRDDPVVATRAYDDRRWLLADRLVGWAAPWFDAVGRCLPARREPAHRARDLLLELADRYRVAPLLVDGEGLTVPGEDLFGALAPTDGEPTWEELRSLASGAAILEATLRSMGLDPDRLPSPASVPELVHLYRASAGRWRRWAQERPGSAHLWTHLARRADGTADRLERGTAGG